MVDGEEKVSNEDLDNAIIADGIEPDQPLAEKETPEEEIEKKADEETSGDDETLPEKEGDEEIPEEPEDNTERSKLGRKVAAIESSIESMIEGQNAFLSRLESTLKKPEDDLEDEIGDEEFLNKKDLETYLSRREAKISAATDKYNSDYNALFTSLSKSTDSDLHKEIMDELIANHNIKRSTDGLRDAEINYLHAKAGVLEKRINKPKESPLEKNKDNKPKNLGGESETITTPKPEPVIKLDEHATQFLEDSKKQGREMSQDAVKEALGKDEVGGLKNTRFSQA